MSSPFLNRRVKVAGVSKAELNNQEGRATAYNSTTMRYTVELDSGDTVALKPSNLIPVGPSDEDADSGSSGGGFGGMPASMPDISKYLNIMPGWLKAKLMRGEMPNMNDVKKLLPPGLTTIHLAGIVGLFLVLMYKKGIARAGILGALMAFLVYAGYGSFVRADGTIAGIKAAYSAIGDEVAKQVRRKTQKTLPPKASLGVTTLTIVAVLYYVFLSGGKSPSASASSYAAHGGSLGLTAAEAYALGFDDATQGKPRDFYQHAEAYSSGNTYTYPDSSSYDSIPNYVPHTTSGGIGSILGNFSFGKLFSMAILGKQLHGLGSVPGGGGWSKDLAVANFMNMGGMQKGFLALMVLRLFGMSPI